MDAARFDAWTRRRFGLAAGGALAALWSLVGITPAPAKKKKKLKFNEFGCVNVGGKCRGKDANCCSNICQGEKPKQGKKDKSRCVAHDEQGCQAGQIEDFCGGADVPCTTSAPEPGLCNTTTGNAGYCADFGVCFPCQKDLDCQNQSQFGPGSACVLCAPCAGGTGCAVLA
jgi:hypothetical protein